MTTAIAEKGFIPATLRLPASRGGRQLRTSLSRHRSQARIAKLLKNDFSGASQNRSG